MSNRKDLISLLMPVLPTGKEGFFNETLRVGLKNEQLGYGDNGRKDRIPATDVMNVAKVSLCFLINQEGLFPKKNMV